MIKCNAIVDNAAIEALYEASGAGVEIDLIVRGACCLVPGVEGVSERIRVRSIVGEFLEHSRIWMFANGGRPEWYIGSADLMERNLDRRVEVVTPVDDPEATARLARIIEVMLADDRRSWLLQPDGALDPDRGRAVAPGDHRDVRRAQGGRRGRGRRRDGRRTSTCRPARWTRARDGTAEAAGSRSRWS